MRKIINLLFQKPDPREDWIVVRMRAVIQQIGPRHKSGLFTEYREGT